LRRETGVQVKRIISETVAGKPVRENLQESAVTGQEAKGRIRSSIQSVEIARFFRELVKWKPELIINFYRKWEAYIRSASGEKVGKRGASLD
jgi:hypothetical protein